MFVSILMRLFYVRALFRFESFRRSTPRSRWRRLACSTAVRQTIRAWQYSPKTEKSYVAWIRRYVVFHGKRHPSEMGTDEVREFLSWLATEKRVSASTQNQALSALLFLYAS